VHVDGQTLPHPPQLYGSLSVSAQLLPQHSGLTPPQELPHEPQLFVSLSSSTHPLSQHPGLTP